MGVRDWLPSFCSRRSIFISFASEHREAAGRIAQTLTNEGHRVFFDKDSLPPASDFNERIRKAIRQSERFLFIASRNALEQGKYTLTELDFARRRWPSPVGRVYTVILDEDLNPATLPAYLSSVHALTIAGNAPAEIAAMIEDSGGVNTACRWCLGLLAIGLAAIAWLGVELIPRSTPIVIVPTGKVILMPRAHPPDNPSTPGADTSWQASPVTLIWTVAYRNLSHSPVELLSEQISLQVGGDTWQFDWAFIVVTGDGCEHACQKGIVKAENLKPREVTATRETRYLPRDVTVPWVELIDRFLSLNGPKTATVTLRSEFVAPGEIKRHHWIESVCTIDVAAKREEVRANFPAGGIPTSAWQLDCVEH